MAPYPITNIRIDPELKAEAKGIQEDLGLNLSSAIGGIRPGFDGAFFDR